MPERDINWYSLQVVQTHFHNSVYVRGGGLGVRVCVCVKTQTSEAINDCIMRSSRECACVHECVHTLQTDAINDCIMNSVCVCVCVRVCVCLQFCLIAHALTFLRAGAPGSLCEL